VLYGRFLDGWDFSGFADLAVCLDLSFFRSGDGTLLTELDLLMPFLS